MSYNEKVIVEISEFNSCKITVQSDNGTKENKVVTYDELLKLLNSASADYDEDMVLTSSDYVLSDVLPGDSMVSTIQVKEMTSSNSKWYVLLREGIPSSVIHRGYSNGKITERKYNNVAMPRTLFAIKVCNNRCVSLRICCVKDGFINDDSIVYRYPYSNVFDTRSVCLGSNVINDFDLGVLSNIAMIPEMFLSMPNNNDGYRGSNTSGFDYPDLLELMSGSEFDNDILTESNYTPTYKKFIESLR